MDQMFSGRKGLTQNAKVAECFLKFDSDFECGNLDAVIQRTSTDFDLFMRVDTNTHGHQNWFYFSIQNPSHVNKLIKINICNVKRDFKMILRGQKIFMRSKNVPN